MSVSNPLFQWFDPIVPLLPKISFLLFQGQFLLEKLVFLGKIDLLFNRAVQELKKPKIAELMPLLSEPFEKAGYIEFHLDKPKMGRDIYVGFSCLDSKSEREDNESRKTLKNLVKTALLDTNWRLMSDVYLTGSAVLMVESGRMNAKKIYLI